MTARFMQPKRLAWFSPWMIIGSVCILGIILLILAVKHVERQREFMVRTLVSEATVLMRSLEASTRTGMMGMGWGRRQLQVLMEQTSQQPDVVYVALVTGEGQIVTHSDPEKVGTRLSHALPPARTDQVQYRFIEEVPKTFEVLRPYQPWRMSEHRGMSERRGKRDSQCPMPPRTDSEEGGFLVVGLDPTPFEASIRHDIQQTIILSGMLLLIGAAAFVSLTWAQHYRSARRSLQDIQAFTSTLLNQMPVGFMATDLEGNVQRTNEAAKSILHQTIEPRMSIRSFPCFMPLARQLKGKEIVLEEEVHFAIHETLKVPLHVVAALLRDGEQNVVGHVFLFTDMTNIRQLEEQLRRSERLAALGRLAAGIAHEIRNPLSSIKGFAAILAGKMKEDAQGRKIAQVMQQEVERLNRVICELLDFARPTELHKHSHSCRELIQNTLRLVEADTIHQGITLESRVEPVELEAQVDPDRFAQILLNLYLNALQAMDSGGRLEVEVRRQSDQILWTVRDSGRGICAQDLPHIFDPYFTTKPQGVGLGLAIVHKLVEAHGGDIEVASTPTQGTSFTIRLPVQDSHNAANESVSR